jgi:hypothetical protein
MSSLREGDRDVGGAGDEERLEQEDGVDGCRDAVVQRDHDAEEERRADDREQRYRLADLGQGAARGIEAPAPELEQRRLPAEERGREVALPLGEGPGTEMYVHVAEPRDVQQRPYGEQGRLATPATALEQLPERKRDRDEDERLLHEAERDHGERSERPSAPEERDQRKQEERSADGSLVSEVTA